MKNDEPTTRKDYATVIRAARTLRDKARRAGLVTEADFMQWRAGLYRMLAGIYAPEKRPA